MTYQDPKAIYVCINHGEAHALKKIAERVMCINKDLQKVTEDMGWTYAQVVCPQKLYIRLLTPPLYRCYTEIVQK